MKLFFKRSLSLLMALTICLGLMAGVTFPASAASYVYNWGTREDVADETDFARSSAEEWYKSHGVSYEELSQYTGSKTQSSVPSSELYQALKTLMTKAHSNQTSYDATQELYRYTDCQNGGGKISSFYSGTAIGPGWNEGGDWNREHTWPKSKSLNGNSKGGKDEDDIIMLRPTSTSENSSRGNTAYGERYYDPNDESGGKLNLRGDCARICLYVYTRWGNTQYMWGSSGVMESREILLKWMEEDPVDTWELGRNDSVESITGTRNVFVDYPELGFQLFGEEVPDNYATPSGEANAVSYNITATSNNTSYGTVSLSGKTITATPKAGYYASGYTVTSGTATVTQSGNTFRVNPSSDCTVRINFAAKTAVKLTFMENGIAAKTVNSYGGDSVTLPSNTNTVAEGYSFLGWTDNTLSDTTTKPTIYPAGTSVTASNKTYYAVYTYAVGGTGVTEYVLKDITEIKSGDVFVITVSKSGSVYALPNALASTAPKPVTVSAANGKLTADPAANLLWNIGGSTNAWIFYPDGLTSRWLSGTADNAGVRVDTGANNTFEIKDNYLYNKGTGRYYGVYNTQDWRCYTSIHANIANQTLGFYVKSESGTAYYTTSTYVCEHEDTTTVAAVAATCTETGYTAGVYCNDCDQFIEGHTLVDALGHNWGAWVQTSAPTCTATGTETATCSRCGNTKTQSVAATGHSYSSVVTKPTETQQGYTTYTCGTCGHSYVGNYTEALGETFYVSFNVPKDVASVATMECGKNGITLPTANAPEGYSFLGWTTAPVEDTETKPSVLTGTYTAKSDITLYAVYSYVESDGNQPSGVYTLHSGEITEGEYVIVYNGYALKAQDSNNNTRLDPAAVTATNNAITNPDALVVWRVAKEGNYYTLFNESAGMYAAGLTSDNKSTMLESITNYTKWTVTGNSTYEFKNAGNSRLLRLNGTNVGWGCYSTSTGGAVSLYKGYTGTTYYTTLDPVAMVGNTEYTSFEAAYAAANGQFVTLLADTCVNVLTLDKDLYLDLNGHNFDVSCATGPAFKIYIKDSTTDDFETIGSYANIYSGDVWMYAADGYVMNMDNFGNCTFNAYELAITHVSLDATRDALGYKATLKGNANVQAAVTSYGFTMGVVRQETVSKNGSIDDGTFSLRLTKIMASKGGEKEIAAEAFVVFNEDTENTVTTKKYTTSMKETILAVNDIFSTLSETQQAAVLALYGKYETVMAKWLEGKTNHILPA